MIYNENLHLFFDNKEIANSSNVYHMSQIWRKECYNPIISPEEEIEGSTLGYCSVLKDDIDNIYRMWYIPHTKKSVYKAVSEDGISWTKTGCALDFKHLDCLQAEKANADNDNRFVFTLYGTNKGATAARGIYTAVSDNGDNLKVTPTAVLPNVGDRSSLYYDEVRELYMFASRPPETFAKEIKPLHYRKIALWESKDLIEFDYKGIIHSPESESLSNDYPIEYYGMQIFRYGNMFIGLLERFYSHIQRLDTTLAYSYDGYNWHNTCDRTAILATGGEGSWDSHWVVPAMSKPIIKNDRIYIYYSGGSTKHTSRNLHKRAVGLASIRKDGWISMESGKDEGFIITTPLSLIGKSELKVNISFPTGYFGVEILREDGSVIDGYTMEKSVVYNIDDCNYHVKWDKKAFVDSDVGKCRIRFIFQKGSLFSYTWTDISKD